MVYHAGRVAARQQGFKLRPQLPGRLEPAIRTEVVADRAVQRAGDVAGHRVQRLHLAAKTCRSTGVHQGLAGLAKVVGHCFAVHQPRFFRTGQEDGLEVRRLFAAVDRAAGCRIVSGPLEHPPQAATVVGAVAVIHHRLHVIAEADAG